MPFRPMQLKQISLVVQRKLHDVRPFADIARDKRWLRFSIEANDARCHNLDSGGRKFFPVFRHMDVRKRKACEWLQKRDLGLGRGDFFHMCISKSSNLRAFALWISCLHHFVIPAKAGIQSNKKSLA